jgi:hypothetical protein
MSFSGMARKLRSRHQAATALQCLPDLKNALAESCRRLAESEITQSNHGINHEPH